jgi:chitodextrinase
MKTGIVHRAVFKRLLWSIFVGACALLLIEFEAGCGGADNDSTMLRTSDANTPSAPTNLVAAAVSGTQTHLAWNASTDNKRVAEYKIERCTGAGCSNFVQVATSTATTFNDSGLTASTTYCYRVRAADAAGDNSPYSNVSTTITSTLQDTTPPTAPTNLAAAAISSTQINLAWNASTDNVGVTGYAIERCTGAGCSSFAQIGTSNVTTFSDTGLVALTSYSYRILANDAAANNSAYSNTVLASTPEAGSIMVTISPKRGGLATSQTITLTATVANDAGNAGVTWTASGGNFSAMGSSSATYVAPSLAGTVTVTATSVADGSVSATATFGITDLTGMFTYHNDLSRDGVNSQEYALTTANVATTTFGKLFSCATDAAIYAQPLWVAKLNIQGGTHNVIYAATVHNTVYAFDADTSPCVMYWSTSLLGSDETFLTNSDVGANNIFPDMGIIGTPVIDPQSNTLYVVSKSKNVGTNCTPSTSCHQRLHALSLIDGSEKFGGPVEIASAVSVVGTGDGTSGGKVTFNALRQLQRPGLALVNGVVYIAWASHGDIRPYHGWVVGYNNLTLQQAATFNANPNGGAAGIWMSGGAPAADAAGNLYFLTGNGTFDADSGGSDYGDSTLKLSTAGSLSVAGYFTPADQQSLEGNDTDHGAGGATVLVDLPSTAVHPHLLIGGGKEGNLFLLDRDNMGGYGANYNPADSNALQKFSVGSAIMSTAAFFNNTLYVGVSGGYLQSFAFNTTTGLFNTVPTALSTLGFPFPGASPSVSASGTNNGIVWAMDSSSFGTGNSARSAGPTILHAYDAANIGTELWNSSLAIGNSDQAGNAVKFTVPTVANGKVYIGTRGNDSTNGSGTVFGEIDVYGLLPN